MKFKALTRLCTTLGLFTMLLGSAQAVTIDVFTNVGSWIGATGSYAVEDFNDNVLAAPLQSITGLGTGPSINGVVAGKLWDVVDQDAAQDTTFTFDPGIYGMGGFWDLFNPSGPGTEIILRTTSGAYSLGLIPRTTSGTFWGFTIDEQLMDVYLVEGGFPSAVETYTLDNLYMATVPEPVTLALIGIGLAGFGFSRKRKV